MRRSKKQPEINYDASPSPSSDPTFDIRRGLFWLVVVIAIMIGLSLICAFLR